MQYCSSTFGVMSRRSFLSSCGGKILVTCSRWQKLANAYVLLLHTYYTSMYCYENKCILSLVKSPIIIANLILFKVVSFCVKIKTFFYWPVIFTKIREFIPRNIYFGKILEIQNSDKKLKVLPTAKHTIPHKYTGTTYHALLHVTTFILKIFWRL